ncbi:MAG: hypothetical protein IT336_17255 [Thermomicrobiales bacterium]|nr:hypothetical protein [Thermomicrobiales bacterium]
MPTISLVAAIAVYLVIVVLLLSLNLTSRYRWWIKGGAVVAVGALFVGSYFAIASILGWPASGQLPQRFSLLWSHVVEPDKFTGAPGEVYVWTEKLDENDLRTGVPRSFILPYSRPLQDNLEDANEQLRQGEPVLFDPERQLALTTVKPRAGEASVTTPGAPDAATATQQPQVRVNAQNLPLVVVTVAAYVLVAVLLLSLHITSRWRWWIKGTAIVVTTRFFGWTYMAINSLLGWPTQGRLPERFSLLWTEVVKPDQIPGVAPAIYLWVDELDEFNIPVGLPRAYRTAYTVPAEETVEDAQERLDQGEEVMGSMKEATEEELELARKNKEMGQQNPDAEQSAAMDTVPFMEQDLQMTFQDLPPVVLPDKGPL